MDLNKIYAKPYYNKDEVRAECDRLNNDDSLFEDMSFANCAFAASKRRFEIRHVVDAQGGDYAEWRITGGESRNTLYKCRILNKPCRRIDADGTKDCSDCNVPIIFYVQTKPLLNTRGD